MPRYLEIEMLAIVPARWYHRIPPRHERVQRYQSSPNGHYRHLPGFMFTGQTNSSRYYRDAAIWACAASARGFLSNIYSRLCYRGIDCHFNELRRDRLLISFEQCSARLPRLDAIRI